MRKGSLLAVLLVVMIGIMGCGKSSTPTIDAPKTAPAQQVPVKDAQAGGDVGEVEEAAPVAAPPAAPAPVAVPPVAAPAQESAAAPEAVQAPEGGGVPKLVVPNPEYNFGKLDNSETAECQFVLRNEGTGLLKIENVRASCGCTATALDKNELAPGEEVVLHASTNLKGRQGLQTKAVTVMSNDPDQPTFQLKIVGEAIASISIEPMAVQFGRIEDNEPREQKVVIQSNKEDITFKVQSAEIEDMDFIQHEIKEVEPGKKYEMIVKAAGDLPVGNHNGRFIIRTDSPERAVIWLPVSMQVIGALEVMPPVVNIRFSEVPDEMEQQQLSITAGRVAEFKINEVVVPLDTIQHELIEAGPNAYRLRLSNMPRTDALDGKNIILRTNLKDTPEVEIPFNIYKPRVRQLPTPPPAPATAAPAAAAAPAATAVPAPPAGVEDVSNAPEKAKQ